MRHDQPVQLLVVAGVDALAHSRPVTLSAQLKNYGGDGAYLAVYLTDAKGAYAGTLWVAGGKVLSWSNFSPFWSLRCTLHSLS